MKTATNTTIKAETIERIIRNHSAFGADTIIGKYTYRVMGAPISRVYDDTDQIGYQYIVARCLTDDVGRVWINSADERCDGWELIQDHI